MHTMKEKSVLHNEDGSVLIISLVIMAFLLVIGISATTTSNIENLVTRNVEQYTVALYRAEAAAMEAAQNLNDASPNPRDNPPDLLNPNINAITDTNIVNENYWGTDSYVKPSGIEDADFLAEAHGVVGGSTLDTDKSNVYGYTAYGRCRLPSGATVIIGVGYRRAF